jgi:hypothetical protein
MPSPPATLNLCFGEAHEDLLSHHQVFAEHRFAFMDGHATLYVIGASSIVLVETRGVRLAEMIACGPSRGGFRPSCEAGLSLHAGSEGRVAHQSASFAYEGQIRAEKLQAGMSESARPLSQQVRYRFPSTAQPLTEIEADELEPGRLLVRTVHEYPEWNVSVRSSSRWELPTGG